MAISTIGIEGRKRKIQIILPALLVAILAASVASAAAGPTDLRCEYRKDPLGMDAAQPRLSWILDSGRQSAYQVVVEGAWDSGKVASDQSVGVEYAGKPLRSGTRYEWKVRVWDQDDKPSDWSAPASWTLGLPREAIKIKSLSGEKIAAVTLLGSDAKPEWKQTADALIIQPVAKWPCPYAVAFKIQLKK